MKNCKLPEPNEHEPLIPPPASVAVLGAARSGQAAARLLAEKGYQVYLSDSARTPKLESECEALSGLGIEIELGQHNRKRLAASKFIVVSPGIDESKGLLTEPFLYGIPLFGEIEIGYWFCPLPVAAVTGTNGKSTTTALVGHLLNTAGVPCKVAGNIGYAFCRAISELKDEKVIVAEISSYQLHTIRTFRPRVGTLLNLSPDHLDRYGEVRDYYSAKLRLFDIMGPGDTAIFNADQPETAEWASLVGGMQPAWFGFKERVGSLAFSFEGSLFVRGRDHRAVEVISLKEFPLPGRHNQENLLAAAATATALGLEPESIRKGVPSFVGLPHRLEIVVKSEGVTWVNDSKATTVDSVQRALESYKGPVILIMGGRHKGAPYKPLADQVRAKVKRLVLIGEAADLIHQDLGGLVPVSRADSLEAAVKASWTFSSPGDTIMLSPGCASFDMFTDFEQRGDRFREAVRRIVADAS